MPSYPGFSSVQERERERERKKCHTPWKVVSFLWEFVSLSSYTSVSSKRKQHVRWSRLGKKFVFPNKPNIYTPHLHVFPLCPVETVETVLAMAFAFYLTNPVCGLLAACSRTLHSSGDFPFESDHNSEVWSCAASGIFFFFNEMITKVHFK